ncbi:MAG: PaaI family thioesterase [Ectothiorhodospiraceae bacterium]|nr:PaaI family thioesterase [Ectothiorhodospiraceae bacterium]
MDELLERGQAILAAQPFSNLMGTELTALEPGHAELRLAIRESVKQQHGFVHGGVVSYLADNCLTYAGGTVLGNCVTSEFKVNYVRPAVGDLLVANATVLATGQRQAVCECKVHVVREGKEVLVAAAQGTIVRVE